jgi:hypothetical protein
MLSLVQGAEIQKAKVNRLLELIGIRTSEQDIGDMRLDDLKLIHGMIKISAGLKRLDQPKELVICKLV